MKIRGGCLGRWNRAIATIFGPKLGNLSNYTSSRLDSEAPSVNIRNWKIRRYVAALEAACLVSFSGVSRERQRQVRN